MPRGKPPLTRLAQSPGHEHRGVVREGDAGRVLGQRLEDCSAHVRRVRSYEHRRDSGELLNTEFLARRGGALGDAVGVQKQSAARLDPCVPHTVDGVGGDAEDASRAAQSQALLGRNDERGSDATRSAYEGSTIR